MGGSSRQPTVTSSSREPWAPAQPYLAGTMGEAQNLYNNDVGFRPFTGQRIANLDPRTTRALQMGENIAGGSNPLVSGAQSTLQNVMDRSGMPTSSETNLAGMASGQDMGANDPYLRGMLDTNSRRIGDQVASSMSGAGRYGSFAHGSALADRIQENNNPVLFQANEAARQRQMQASGQIDSARIAQGQQGMAASAMAPSIYDFQFAPTRQLAGIGDFYQGREQARINDLMAQWDQAEARPWDMLARANAIYSGAGQLGGTGSQTNPYQGPSTAQSALGGAIAGGAAFGPGGALGGGLLGLL